MKLVMSAECNKEHILRRNSLDYICILAAIQVMIAHTSAYIIGGGSGTGILMWQIIAPGPAVVVFFAISGFLSTASFERSGGIKRFYLKRILRIYPALIVAILIPGMLYSITGLVEINWIKQIPFYLKKLLTGRGHDIVPEGALGNGSLWTIFVQIQFYILTPFLYKFLKNINRVYHVIVILLFLIENLLHDHLLQIIDIPIIRRLYEDTCITYLYMYLVGMCIFINRELLLPLLTNKLILLSEIVIYVIWHWVVCVDLIFDWTYINPVSAILASCIALGLGYFLGEHRVKYDISFGLFLWHLPVTDILHCVFGMEYSICLLLVVWFLSVLIALANCFLIEKPMFELSKRIVPKF